MDFKYKIADVAKEFGMPAKKVVETVSGVTGEAYKTAGTFEEKELNVLLETLTRENAEDSLDAYLASGKEPAPAPKAEKKPEAPKAEEKADEELIDIDTFAKVKLKVAKVVAAEAVKKSNKLLKLTVKCGDETRTVVSGISTHYSPEDMVGKTVVLVANLKPAKLKGIVSEGMLLAAADDEKGTLRLLTVDGDIADGTEIG